MELTVSWKMENKSLARIVSLQSSSCLPASFLFLFPLLARLFFYSFCLTRRHHFLNFFLQHYFHEFLPGKIGKNPSRDDTVALFTGTKETIFKQ